MSEEMRIDVDATAIMNAVCGGMVETLGKRRGNKLFENFVLPVSAEKINQIAELFSADMTDPERVQTVDGYKNDISSEAYFAFIEGKVKEKEIEPVCYYTWLIVTKVLEQILKALSPESLWTTPTF